MPSLINMAPDAPAAKATKAEARYTPKGTMAEHCAICAHYDAGECERVQGRVAAEGWCRYFHRKAR